MSLTIPFSPDELWAAYERTKNGGDTKKAIGIDDANYPPNLIDIDLVAPMLEYLGEFNKPHHALVNPTDELLTNHGRFEKPKHYYRCKHFDEQNKICTIYEHRPAMCSAYPYGNKCQYQDCTWSERRDRKETSKQRKKRLHILTTSLVSLKHPGGDHKRAKSGKGV